MFFGSLTVFATYNYSVKQFSKEKEDRAMLVVSHGVEVLNEVLTQSRRMVQIVAKDRTVYDLVTTKSKKQTAETILELNNFNLDNRYSAIYIIGIDGIVLASTDASFMNQDYGFREYFIRAKAGELYSDVNLGVTSKKLGYYFAYPILDKKSEVVGVAVLKMNDGVVGEIIKNTFKTPLTDLMLTDRNGIVVNGNKIERLYQSLGKLNQNELGKIEDEKKYVGIEIKPLQYDSILKLIRNKLTSLQIVDVFDQKSNDRKKIIVSPVSGVDFYLVGEISVSEVVSQAQSISKIIALMVTVAVLMAMIYVVLLSTSLLKPLSSLSTMARNISLGKFGQTNPVLGGGELAILGQTMETMANELGEKYVDLEKLVAERTTEIESQKEFLEKSKVAMMNVLEDVNLAKTDLEKFKLAVEEASDHIVITDSEGMVLYANRAVEKITGYSQVEVIGNKAGNKGGWGGLMEKSFYKKLWKTIKIDKKVFTGEINNLRKNGEKYIAIASISPILGQNGEVMFFVAIERDVTHEKEVDRMKTDFISLASHQLRTPLSAMRWFAEMLLAGDAGKLSKEQTEFVKNIEQANAKMIVLVNSLLNISRIESGRIVVDPVPTDLKELVLGELKGIEKNIKDKKQTALVSVDRNLPKVNVDPKLIAEVYKNLLTNANKYSPDGGEIEIFISHKDGELISRVSDNGIGIPKVSQDKVFERFYRAPNVLKMETEGTGLGLYLAKAIVESSGGRIWFESEVGKGTTFWFTLPLSGMKKKKGEVTING